MRYSLPVRSVMATYYAYASKWLIAFCLIVSATRLFSQSGTPQVVVNVQQTGFTETRVIAPNSTFTIPPGGPYVVKIEARGGSGGVRRVGYWGRGAVVTAYFNLPSGYQLQAIAGSNGAPYMSTNPPYLPSGGGGSSGVQLVGIGPLLVAGGGGGGVSGRCLLCFEDISDATVMATASTNPVGGLGASGTANTTSWFGGGGGGGTNSNGFNDIYSRGGGSYVHGGHGGPGFLSHNGVSLLAGGAGFSGGGSASSFIQSASGEAQGAGGGGGGYSGGDGGRWTDLGQFQAFPYEGKGGTSFVSTLAYQVDPMGLTDNTQAGGSVTITFYRRLSAAGRNIPSRIPDCFVPTYNKLEALYDFTNGDNWTDKTGWLTDGDLLNWKGLTVTPEACDVAALDLSNNNLVGDVGQVLIGNNGIVRSMNFTLPACTSLNLSNNRMRGNFQVYLPIVQNLNLSNNQLTGTPPIPASGTHVNLSNNQFDGQLFMSGSSNLVALNLSSNRVVGAIPDFSGCMNLNELNLSGNRFTGSIPVFTSPGLQKIDLSSNRLTGTIPTALYFYNFTTFNINNNNLTGTFPDIYSPFLQTLNISNNQFSGNVPTVNSFNLNTGLFPINIPNFYLSNNNYNFGNMLGRHFLGTTGTLQYAPQNEIPLSFASGVLTMNTGITSGDPSVTYNWYRNGLFITSSQVNTYTPVISGIYTCQATHNTLTVAGNANKNLILTSSSYDFVGITTSNGGRTLPEGLKDCWLDDFNELEKIYEATAGASWTNKTNWLTNKDLSTWHGVTMTDCGVTAIALNVNNLVGTIPNLTLPNLTSLNLSVNNLSGTMPNFNSCTRLSYLNVAINRLSGAVPNFTNASFTHIDLGINQLTGTIPALSLPNLTFFSVYDNQMTGSIPDMNLPALTTLHLSFNQFSGGISDFGASPNLSLMYIDNNKFNFASIHPRPWRTLPNCKYAPQGTIPITFTFGNLDVYSGFSDLQHTYEWFKDGVLVATQRGILGSRYAPSVNGVYSCKIYHEVFTVTGDPLKNLVLQSETIDLNRTSNGGRPIPVALPACLVDDFNELEKIYDATGGANWANKTNWFTNPYLGSWHGVTLATGNCDVASISLNGNNLTGTFPTVNLPNLTYLNLSINTLSGVLPNFSSCPQLSYLNVAINNLTGVPSTLPTALTHLDLGINQITGAFPNWSLPNLTFLSFYQNQFSGTIPSTLNYPALTTLYLSHNQFTGLPEPTSFPALTTLYATNNQMSGAIPNYANLSLFHFDKNRFVFGDIIGRTWLNAPDIKYLEQSPSIPITYNNCVLTVHLPSADGTEIIDWYKDDVFVARTFTPNYTPSVSGTYFCQIQHPVVTVSNSVNRNLILKSSAQVVQIAAMSIAVAPSQTIYAGARATFAVNASNILGTPQYQWYKNGNLVGANSPYFSSTTLVNGDVITCTLTAASSCPSTLNSNSLTMTVTNCPTSGVVYVKPTATGNGTGSSWANATNNLQAALDNPCATQVWVAAGTYKPTATVNGDNNPTDNRDKVFYIKNGVKLYGGFAGTELNLGERTPSVIRANPTILSGDFGNDDVVTGSARGLSLVNYENNAFHVVVFYETTTATRLDGCTITGGSGGGGDVFANGWGILGGGIWNANSSTNVTIANCIISKNGAVQGGGMFNQNASPTITNCVFERNSASASHGGGIVNYGFSRPNISNCIFSGNYADGVGGGIANFTGSEMTLVNATLSGNFAIIGGGVYNDGSNATILNSIIWNNTLDGLGNNLCAPSINFSILQEAYGGNTVQDPLFVNAANPVGADGIWGTIDDGLRLSCGSPAYNMGTNNNAPATDMNGITRPQFGFTDIGAYENTSLLSNASTRVYVKTAASGNGDGSSWANATNNLQAVLNANPCGTAATEIWVAGGIYSPTQDPTGNPMPTNNRDKTFLLRNGIKLYGGFAGTETTLAQRTPSVNSTILSGDLNGDDNGFTNNGENAYHVVVSINDDNTTVLDGFVVTGGNASEGVNTTIEGVAMSRANGGGLVNYNSNQTITNCVFTGNSAGVGGGVCNLGGSSATMRNLVIHNNLATYSGGVFNQFSSPQLLNCTVSSNTASLYADGIYNQFNSSPTITNSIIWGNGNLNLYNEPAQNNNPTITYSIVQGGFAGTGNVNSNPIFADASNAKGVDNQWFTADDGLRLQNTSPAIDAGTNANALATDVLNNATYNLTKDIGAYESQEGQAVYSGGSTCQSIVVNNVSGNQWFYFRSNNTIVAAINPNGMNLGTVTASISDATGAISFTNSKFLGRTVNFTSANYADGVTMPSNYTLRLYYSDAELTELNQLTGGNAALGDFNMAWQQGTTGCTLSSAFNVGILLKSNITTGEYGPNNNGFFMQFPLNHFTVFAPTTSGSSVLPVELVNFSGYTEGGNNLLVWTTANEINNKGFQIERLNPTTKAWESIGFVDSKSKAAIYDFTDKAPFSVSYYRLRQIDNDGKELLSKVISLSIKGDKKLKVSPNPTTDVILVETSSKFQTATTLGSAETTFEVFNILGKKVLEGKMNQSVDVSALSNGSYIVRVGLEQVKFVKQ